MFYYALSLSIDFVDYSDICRHFCSVLLCSEPIYWLCWLFRYLWALLTCFIMFWTHLFDYTDICGHFWHVLLCSEPIYLTIDMYYYVLSLSTDYTDICWYFCSVSLSIDFVDYSDICRHFWSVLLCSESIYWLCWLSIDTFVVFFDVLSLSIDFLLTLL